MHNVFAHFYALQKSIISRMIKTEKKKKEVQWQIWPLRTIHSRTTQNLHAKESEREGKSNGKMAKGTKIMSFSGKIMNKDNINIGKTLSNSAKYINMVYCA